MTIKDVLLRGDVQTIIDNYATEMIYEGINRDKVVLKKKAEKVLNEMMEDYDGKCEEFITAKIPYDYDGMLVSLQAFVRDKSQELMKIRTLSPKELASCDTDVHLYVMPAYEDVLEYGTEKEKAQLFFMSNLTIEIILMAYIDTAN